MRLSSLGEVCDQLDSTSLCGRENSYRIWELRARAHFLFARLLDLWWRLRFKARGGERTPSRSCRTAHRRRAGGGRRAPQEVQGQSHPPSSFSCEAERRNGRVPSLGRERRSPGMKTGISEGTAASAAVPSAAISCVAAADIHAANLRPACEASWQTRLSFPWLKCKEAQQGQVESQARTPGGRTRTTAAGARALSAPPSAALSAPVSLLLSLQAPAQNDGT